MEFIYETHLHTMGPSRCARATGKEMAAFVRSQGFAGMVVTDHFFNGNSGIPADLPWVERVRQYMAGYREAKEYGDAHDFDVLFGIEWNFQGDEYLLYGPDEDWLVSHPHMLEWSHGELFDRINEIGGLMVQAHPFRDRDYISKIHLHPEHVHAIELVNAGNYGPDDRMAGLYAEHFGFKTTAGSDLHTTILPQRGLKGVVSKQRLKTAMDYVKLIKSGDYTLHIEKEDVLPLFPDDRVTKPVEMRGLNNEDRTPEILDLFGKERFGEEE